MAESFNLKDADGEKAPDYKDRNEKNQDWESGCDS